MAITLGQAPLMALAFFLVFNTLLDYTSLKSFEPLRKYATPDIIIFLAVLSAVWFGFDKAISEIPSSKTFYDQERLSFLSDSAFILSRFFALSIIAFGQVLLFALVFHTIFVVIPNKLMIELLVKFILLLWLTSIASIATAMVISFFIKTPSAAKAILPFIIILQILMGGSRIRPLIDMKGVVYGFSHIMTSRWGFEAAALLFDTHLDVAEKSILFSNMSENSYRLKENGYSDISNIFKAVMLLNIMKSDNSKEGIDILSQILKKDKDKMAITSQQLRKIKMAAFEIAVFRDFYSEFDSEMVKKYHIASLHSHIITIFQDLNDMYENSDIGKKIDDTFNKLMDGKKLNEDVEKERLEIWAWMVSVNPKIKLFRPIHAPVSWLALFIISVSMLVLLRILFAKGRWKDLIAHIRSMK